MGWDCQEWVKNIKETDIANLIGKSKKDAEEWCKRLLSKHDCLILNQGDPIPENIRSKSGIFWLDNDGIIVEARYIV